MKKLPRRGRSWDLGKELNFIGLWQQHPSLFNVSSGSYHDRKRRDAAWKNIAACLRLPVEQVTTRAASLRTQYGKLLRVQEDEGGSHLLTQRQIWILKHLNFLRPHLKRMHNSQQVSDPPMMAFDSSEDPQSVKAASSSSASPIHEPQKPLPHTSSHSHNTRHSQLASAPKMANTPREEGLDFEQEQMKLFKLVTSNNSNGKTDDEDDIFGKQVASEMRLIRDPMDKLLARRAITKVLYDAQDRSMTQSVTISQSASHQMYDFLTLKDEHGEVNI
ncbi:uncharacterized protein LOC114470425 [Gouania willdenowi]|uniref:uncharacterized protein LOC114470425 n=1 Tax=Gouania willdenowi TaxID=441366 RepID=UPI001056BA2C|nr:uncharacterized protein LOC114470425 [Gouania willdenowi]